MVIRQYQIVNGGQTLRMLSAASQAGALRPDVVVPVRVTTSGADKAFANNVAVNLNNQNKVENSFLRSNDPQVVQLQSALASEGWYLERRENDVAILTAAAKAGWTARFGAPLEERTIGLTSGIQAYVATFMHEPELAKRYWKSIFVATSENGNFERVFSSSLTATKIIVAHRVWSGVARFVSRFGSLKRRKDKADDWRAEYSGLLGTALVDKYGAILDVVIPASTIFLTAVIFNDWCDIQNLSPSALVERLESGETAILSEAIMNIIDAHASLSDTRNWPTRLKSDAAYNVVMKHIRSKREAVA